MIDRRELQLLTAHVLRKDYAWVIAHPDHTPTALQRRRLNAYIARRTRGEPIAYLTGKKEFYGHEFHVGKGVLVPRPESELIIDEVLKLYPPSSHGTVVDVGTGSGCLAISIALARPSLCVYAVDNSTAALKYARHNFRHYASSCRVTVFKGDLINPLLKHHISPSCIVANLPYATPREYYAVRTEPRAAIVAGRDGMAAYKKMFRQLRRSGLRIPVIIEIDPRRLGLTKKLIRSLLPDYQVALHHDLARFPRVLTILPRTE